jgi:tetratricopeptide (TPR) repeat protein
MADHDDHRPEVAELSQEGYRLLREGTYDEAVERFTAVLGIEPTNSYALVGLGDIARKRGRQEDAVGFYGRCLEHEPDNAFALFGLADSYRSMRKYHEALKVWERYLEHDNENVTVLTRVADAYRKVRRKQRSSELYLRVLELEPDNPYALIGLGHLHYDFREYEDALASWTRMYELSGASVDIRVLTSIGNCFRKLKTFSGGIPYFEQALEREPTNLYALFGLADCYRGLNIPEKSLTYWNRILEHDPENRVILTRAGDALRSLGRFVEAKLRYEAALAIGDDIYARIGLAVVARTVGNIDDAVDALTTLASNEPDNYRVCAELAETLAQTGNSDAAAKVLSDYRARGNEHASVDELIEQYRERP